MKKFFVLFFALLSLSAIAHAEEPLKMQGTFSKTLVLNTIKAPGEYRVYNDVVYIPLDSYHRSLLAIDVNETDTDIHITRAPDDNAYRDVPEVPAELSGEAFIVKKNVAVFNTFLTPDYPLARCGDVYLLPLTWDCASALGFKLIQTGSEFKVFSANRFEIKENSNDDFYIISDDLAARVRQSHSRFFSSSKLWLYDGMDYQLLDSLFGAFLPDGMSIDGGVLTVKANCFLSLNKTPYSPYSLGDTPSEEYEIKIDFESGKITDTRLLKKRWYNTLYNSFEEDDGSINWDVLYNNEITDSQNYFQYDGGRVILNGTMMRSYTAMIYKVQSRMEDGRIQAAGSSRDSYWIRAEDLENYGYDMRVDYENRATYFTRNPSKEITPLGFEGTNEHIPVYRSDWKIYIDGKEPKQYFNIGGYTMIKAGELGEWEEGKLDDGYSVCYVNTPDMIKPQPKVVGYYSVDVFDEPVEELHTEYLTDVMYAFILPEYDGSLTVPKPETLKAVVEKAHADGTKVHASIGGWGTAERSNVTYFEYIAKNPELTRRFIESCVWLVREYDLDGVEIDWEHPNSTTAALYDEFMLKILSDRRIPSVSASLCGASVDGTPISAAEAVSDNVANALDFINLMCYDANDADHSPYEFSVSSINYWLKRGVSKEKIVLGIPLYARPSFWQYRRLHEAGYDVLHSDFANTPYSASYYNSLDTIKRKTQLAKSIAGGVMFFDVHEDTADETSAVKAAWDILAPVKKSYKQP